MGPFEESVAGRCLPLSDTSGSAESPSVHPSSLGSSGGRTGGFCGGASAAPQRPAETQRRSGRRTDGADGAEEASGRWATTARDRTTAPAKRDSHDTAIRRRHPACSVRHRPGHGQHKGNASALARWAPQQLRSVLERLEWLGMRAEWKKKKSSRPSIYSRQIEKSDSLDSPHPHSAAENESGRSPAAATASRPARRSEKERDRAGWRSMKNADRTPQNAERRTPDAASRLAVGCDLRRVSGGADSCDGISSVEVRPAWRAGSVPCR